MQILEDHMSSLSLSTNEVIVSRAREWSRKLKNSVTQIIVCILLTSNHMISSAIWNKLVNFSNTNKITRVQFVWSLKHLLVHAHLVQIASKSCD